MVSLHDSLKCETDFVANGKDFIALTQSILDAAVAAKAKTLDEVKALPLNGSTVQTRLSHALVSQARRPNLTDISISKATTCLFMTT